jgi:hypothetical protein
MSDLSAFAASFLFLFGWVEYPSKEGSELTVDFVSLRDEVSGSRKFLFHHFAPRRSGLN